MLFLSEIFHCDKYLFPLEIYLMFKESLVKEDEYGTVTPANGWFGQFSKKQKVNNIPAAVATTQSLIIPLQDKENRLTKYPPRNVPPPPAGTVINPEIMN